MSKSISPSTIYYSSNIKRFLSDVAPFELTELQTEQIYKNMFSTMHYSV